MQPGETAFFTQPPGGAPPEWTKSVGTGKSDGIITARNNSQAPRDLVLCAFPFVHKT